ncbi:MAG: hypothetical protein ABS873_06320 [Alkalibacterium sp.]
MMKWNKLLLITASMGLLAACADEGADEEVTEDTEEVSEDTAEESDATTGATKSEIGSADDLEEAVSAAGGWIVIFESDIETDQDLVFEEGPTNDGEIERKLALYTQDADRNVEEEFTLTAPSLTVQSENTRIQNGTFAGDVYVEANNFQLPGGTIDGDLIFASEEYQESAQIEEGEVTGEVRVEEGEEGEESADATTGATQSVIGSADDLEEAFSANGGWIVIFEGDVEADEDLTLADGPTNDGETARKLALYTQDADRNIEERFTLTVPSVTIESDNSRIQGGTVAGDVYVNANNFSMPEGTIEGDLIFGSEEYQDSADLEEGEVTGEVRVEE